MYSAKTLCHSTNKEGVELLTMELTYPRIVHSEFMTHRVFSRNSSSSRAIPIRRMIEQVMTNPYVPTYWGKAQSGMQARTTVLPPTASKCRDLWLKQRDEAVKTVETMLDLGLHKQLPNRLLEPFSWITVIASSTSWQHFLSLRDHPDADPAIQVLASIVRQERSKSTPKLLKFQEWHLPLTGFEGDEKLNHDDLIKCCVGRCARVSYLTHNGTRDVEKDIELHDSLIADKHWSPLEHAAMNSDDDFQYGNFKGYVQYRKIFQDEFLPDTLSKVL